jgi:glycosyltransferase involved in cell wall biosynthesis
MSFEEVALKIGYALTLPLPFDPARDAVTREIDLLRSRFGGELRSLYPLRRYRRWFPARFAGLGFAKTLSKVDREVDVHHVFGPGSRVPRALERLDKPVLYSVTDRVSSGLGRPAGSLAAATVAVDADREALLARGWPTVETAAAGLVLSRFPLHPMLPLDADGPMVLLAGSAPWTRGQFHTKGFDALLDAAVADPRLRLVLLWRGPLEEAIARRVRARALGDRVEVVRETIDVSDRLESCHAALVLASSERVVRPYPHSLIEALSSGRPVLASACLGISDWIARHNAGVVVEDLGVETLRGALEILRSKYRELASSVRELDLTAFDGERYVNRFDRLYRRLAAPRRTPKAPGAIRR